MGPEPRYEFSILKGYEFKEPAAVGGDSQLALAAAARDKRNYQQAHDIFMGCLAPPRSP
jgi:hypothetical protein